MRQLTNIELQEIRQTIMRKEISSAEILMEVYDHFISHLQEFPEQEFHPQLFELDQKFTYAYCHALQAKFKSEAKKDIFKTQWMVVRKYFCTSRWFYLVGSFALIFYLSTEVLNEEELSLLILSPLILLLFSIIAFSYHSFKNLTPIKKIFNQNPKTISSTLSTSFLERLIYPFLIAHLAFYLPNLITNLDLLSFLSAAASISTVLLLLYVLSLLEVWKIKLKTGMV